MDEPVCYLLGVLLQLDLSCASFGCSEAAGRLEDRSVAPPNVTITGGITAQMRLTKSPTNRSPGETGNVKSKKEVGVLFVTSNDRLLLMIPVWRTAAGLTTMTCSGPFGDNRIKYYYELVLGK